MDKMITVPLISCLGMIAAEDLEVEGVKIIKKGQPITRPMIDAYRGDSAKLGVKVENNEKVKILLKENIKNSKSAILKNNGNKENELHKKFDAGTILFNEGDETKEMYVLVKGEVGVYKGDQLVAKINTPGSFFGEMSCLLSFKRTATIKVEEESVMCVVAGESLLVTAKMHPSILISLCKSLATKLNDTTEELIGLRKK